MAMRFKNQKAKILPKRPNTIAPNLTIELRRNLSPFIQSQKIFCQPRHSLPHKSNTFYLTHFSGLTMHNILILIDILPWKSTGSSQKGKPAERIIFVGIPRIKDFWLQQGNIIQGKAKVTLKNWKNLFGNQGEDSFTCLEVCFFLK